LIALDEEEGELHGSIVRTLESVLAGAVLIDLVLHERIKLLDDRVIVTDQSPIEDDILDKTLFAILDTGRPRKLKYWINTIIYEKVTNEVTHYLVKKEVLIRKKKRLRLAILEGNGSIKSKLENRLRGVVLGDQEPELREKVLLAFLYYTDLLKLVFPHKERKIVRKRVKKWIGDGKEGNNLGTPLDEIVAAASK